MAAGAGRISGNLNASITRLQQALHKNNRDSRWLPRWLQPARESGRRTEPSIPAEFAIAITRNLQKLISATQQVEVVGQFGQAGKWNFCLRAAMMSRIRSKHDQVNTTDPRAGL